MKSKSHIKTINSLLPAVILLALLTSCAGIKASPPEVNLLGLQVQDVTLSHVNLLADLRVYNPNDRGMTVQGVDYVLHLNGIKIFSGRSSITADINAQEYGTIPLRLSSAYWNMLQLLNNMHANNDIDFSMAGKIKVGGFGLFGKSYPFKKEGKIPFGSLNRQENQNFSQ